MPRYKLMAFAFRGQLVDSKIVRILDPEGVKNLEEELRNELAIFLKDTRGSAPSSYGFELLTDPAADELAAVAHAEEALAVYPPRSVMPIHLLRLVAMCKRLMANG